MELRPFQRLFVRNATANNITTAALSMPRGNGKSWLAGHLVSRILNPDDELFREGTESVLCAASIKQARIVYRFAREMLGENGYRYLDSAQRVGIIHRATRTGLVVFSSSGKGAFGLVKTPWVIIDEPASMEVNAGTLLHDAIQTSIGKPGSPLRALYIGTLAPAEAGWWHDLVGKGSRPGVHVTCLQGDAETWDRWPTIRKANPLSNISPSFRRQLLLERDEARADDRLRARFLSYRLNVPSRDASEVLLRLEAGTRPPRSGAGR